MDTNENQLGAGQKSGDPNPQAPRVLILQHPRESKRPFGTAAVLQLSYHGTQLSKGLAWPNLKKAWGKAEPGITFQPHKWGVFFLKSRSESAIELEGVLERLSGGQVKPFHQAADLEGIVLLDGNWKEAKTLWWRNPWLSKLRRLTVGRPKRAIPRRRRSPSASALYTAECAAFFFEETGFSEFSQQILRALDEDSAGLDLSGQQRENALPNLGKGHLEGGPSSEAMPPTA